MKPKDLRDEFALAALPGVIHAMADDMRGNHFAGFRWDGANTFEEAVAINTGKVADAMMTEREKSRDYPECSGDPGSCPENEGHGCCGRKP